MAAACAELAAGIAEARELSGEGAGPALLLGLAAHNSDHLGQIVLLRRMLGAWPPPSVVG